MMSSGPTLLDLMSWQTAAAAGALLLFSPLFTFLGQRLFVYILR